MFFFPQQADIGVGNTLGGGPIFGVGLLRQRGAMVFRSAASSGFSALTEVLSSSFTCNYEDSEVEIEFDYHYSIGGGIAVPAGVAIYLYVDGVYSGITPISSWNLNSSVFTRTGRFIYTPGDDSAHTYSLRVQSYNTHIAAKDCWMRCLEYAPNPS